VLKGELQAAGTSIMFGLARAIVATLFVLVCSGADAAEIECKDDGLNGCRTALLRGRIRQGDFEAVKRFLRENHPSLNKLQLFSSPGGDAFEAMKIGRMLRTQLIRVEGPHRLTDGGWTGPNLETCTGFSCVCVSACALIFFGSVDRFGDVGIHRPRITDPEYASLNPNEASTRYRAVISEITRYLDEMEIPQPIRDTMLSTSSEDIKWVETEKHDLKRPRSVSEWLRASCKEITPEEESVYNYLVDKQVGTKSEIMLYRLLKQKHYKQFSCEIDLIEDHRSRLPPP